MGKTASISVRVDPELKERLELIFAKHGITVAQAVRLFLNESDNKKGLPFDLGFSEVPGGEDKKSQPPVKIRRCDFCGSAGAQIKLLKSPLGTCICEDCSLICKILF